MGVSHTVKCPHCGMEQRVQVTVNDGELSGAILTECEDDGLGCGQRFAVELTLRPEFTTYILQREPYEHH